MSYNMPIKADINWYTRTIYLYEKQEGKCSYCQEPLYSKELNDVAFDIDIDHKIPSSRGGKNQLQNYFLSCKPCNNQKADLTETEYRTALEAVSTGKIQKKDLNEYGKYLTYKEKFKHMEDSSNLKASYDRGWSDRTKEIIELAESMKTIIDPDDADNDFIDFDDGRNIALGSLIRSISPDK